VQAATNPENQSHQPPQKINGWKLALDRAPLFLSVLLLFILPFITDPQSVDSIQTKEVLARVLVFLMLGAWAFRNNWSGQFLTISTSALEPLLLLGLWAAAGLFFSPFGPVGWGAFWDRLYLPLWYLLLTQTCLELWRAENLILTFLAAAFGSALWGLGQALGLDSGPWGAVVRDQFQGRVTAGLGNPDFFAGYLLTAWPLALALFLRAAAPAAKILWMTVLAALWAALILTQSMAGWLGGVVGLLVFAGFFFWKNDEAKKFRRPLAALALLVAALTLFSPLRDRLAGLAHSGNPSVQFRQEVWKGTWGLVWAHPLQGSGFGSFAAAFPPYRPESLMLQQQERDYQVDHAHNWVLEWAAEQGLVGLALLAFFWAMVLYQWWKLYESKSIARSLGAGAFAVSAGVGVDNLFDVNAALPSTLVPLLFVAALPVAFSSRFLNLKDFPVRARLWGLKAHRSYLLPLTFLAVLLVLFQIHGAMLNQLTGKMLKRAEAASAQKNWPDALDLYGRILKVDEANDEALYFRGSSYLDRGMEGDFGLALADFNRLAAREPDYLEIHFEKARALAGLGRGIEARQEMEQAVRLDPVLVFQDPDFERARTLSAGRQYKAALPLYQKLVFDYPACVPLLINTANTMVECGQTPSALDLYQRVLAYDPGNPDALSNIAAVKAGKP